MSTKAWAVTIQQGPGCGQVMALPTCQRLWSGLGFPSGTDDQEYACRCRRCKRHRFDPWVRKMPWRRNGHPPQYSCLENPMDRGAWGATVHGPTRSWTRQNDWAHTCMTCYAPAARQSMKQDQHSLNQHAASRDNRLASIEMIHGTPLPHTRFS